LVSGIKRGTQGVGVREQDAEGISGPKRDKVKSLEKNA
jgi:hypothetical protein